MDGNPRLENQQDVHADETQLVEALRRGDENVYVMMVERYHPAMIRLAMAYVHDRAVAEEVAQETWMGMLEGLPRFAGRSSVKTWLFRILVNCARATQRRELRMVPFPTLDDGGEDHSPVVDAERFRSAEQPLAGHWAVPPRVYPEEHLLEAETRSYLQRAILHLPSQQRVVLTLRDVEGWSTAEVCNVLEISEGNQRVLLHRARSRMRQELETYLQEVVEGDQ